ncbi:hypothetical protein AVMA1855_22910 [Acidovorax sp. SUPP1855]|uniref:hypothetical protein n=1 Tax=Acidovorax sp. SUPP1855 TaxID=431774 RepID=UPI0023DE3D3D|nr:hypothetical protein [Acidovorax sp. SUPP1855]GKS87056.1 hypothetical protein AVMA1855_22910 [Acidovorax sp. SUPP1855]
MVPEHERIYNLIVEVEQPGIENEATKAIEQRLNAFLAEHNCLPIQTVSDTIFPAAEYKSGGLERVYDYPTAVYPHIKAVRANQWGTYALRLTERKCADGTTLNPLKLVIDKMKTAIETSERVKKGGPPRATYELDLTLSPLELKLYDAENDYDNGRGGQCLSHVSLKLGPNKELYLTAIYRYQYFVQKALGNFKGLARLQSCIAREVGISTGPLVCHATLAILEEGDGKSGQKPWRQAALKTLVTECEAILAQSQLKAAACSGAS